MSEAPWELPPSWAWSTLDEVASWSSGGTPKPTESRYYGGEIPWLIIGDLNDNLVTSSAKTITARGLENSSAKFVEPGAVMIALYGSIGKLGIAGMRCTTNQAIAFTQAISDGVLQRFLFYYLKAARGRLLDMGKGGAQQNISQTVLKAFPICVAPIAEQQRIVAKLDKLLGQVGGCQQRLAEVPVLLKRFRQSVLAAACSGRLTADWRAEHGSEDAGPLLVTLATKRKEFWERREAARMKVSGKSLEEDKWKRRYKSPFSPSDDLSANFPPTWGITTVSQVAFLDVGFAFKRSEFSDEGIRLLRGENLEPGKLRWNDTRCWPKGKLHGFEYLLIEEGEIILALDRPVISTGLKIARAMKSDVPCLLVQRMMRFKMVELRMTGWLSYNLNLPAFIDHVSKGLTGSDLPHVTGTGVAEYAFGLPPLSEQQEIVRRVENLFALADRIETRFAEGRKRVNSITQAILAKAFRGELVPTEFELAKAEGRSFESAEQLLERIKRNGHIEEGGKKSKPKLQHSSRGGP